MTVDLDQIGGALVTAQRGLAEAFEELRFSREEIARYKHALEKIRKDDAHLYERIRQLEDALKSIVLRVEGVEDEHLLEELKVDIVAQELGWIGSTARDALRRR